MTATATATTPVTARRTPTIWGCTPRQAHDRYWAAFGVQVVRRNERSEIVTGAELFLLCESETLALFRLSELLDALYWLNPRLLLLRVRGSQVREYCERAVTEDDRLVRFERVYRGARARPTRIALTGDRELAELWQRAPDGVSPWRWLRDRVERDRCLVRRAAARLYDGRDPSQVMECVREMMRVWRRPDSTIRRARRSDADVWADETARIDAGAVVVGPVWVGAGRTIEAGAHVVGPAVLWDDPASRPVPDEVRWLELEPAERAAGPARSIRARRVPGKRAFDVVFSVGALVATLPVSAVVALAILLEDGRPIFYAHRRETVGGREFPCFKFRSMRKEAEAAKARLAATNQADGPQFFIEDDPRVTRVGRLIRKWKIDELPQFVNVLAGHMSVVGPRPSPYSENQYCPAWREARLSVRPGITGLWQTSRTRRKGLDFQEWIRFDLAYVEHASWLLDLRILWRTVRVVIAGHR